MGKYADEQTQRKSAERNAQRMWSERLDRDKEARLRHESGAKRIAGNAGGYEMQAHESDAFRSEVFSGIADIWGGGGMAELFGVFAVPVNGFGKAGK